MLAREAGCGERDGKIAMVSARLALRYDLIASSGLSELESFEFG